MRILLIGSGGREHALAWKLARSARIERLFAAPGNPGIGELAELTPLSIADHGAVLAFCRAQSIDLVVVGPEQPLVAGLADVLTEAGLTVCGPSAAAARLEGSKTFTKELCARVGIPTAQFSSFDNQAEAEAHIRMYGAPMVIKVDGLAAGKGVVVAESLDQALQANASIFADDPDTRIVIEELLTGTEASLFALCDGETAIPFGTAQDYKRAFDGDTGPNTGGMGAISPAPALHPDLIDRAMTAIVHPTIAELKRSGAPFRGILYAGLMVTDDGPKLIEYNVRFGDPECQALMPRLESDLVDLLRAVAEGDLAEAKPRWRSDHAVTVTMANPGYPGDYSKGAAITGLEAAQEMQGVTVFQAGTRSDGDRLLATGGRVLNVTGVAASANEARDRAYRAVAAIDWPGAQFRTDIGD